MTDYVVTRWYRAPELLLNHIVATKAIDMWSVGCIMAELLGKDILFKGSSPINQVEKIIQVLGSQQIENIKASPQGLEFLRRLPKYSPQPLKKLFPSASPDALDLLEKILRFNPDDRITAVDALRHPYMSDFFQEKSLLMAEPFDFSFEENITDLISIKKEAFKTILDFEGIICTSDTEKIHKSELDRESTLQQMKCAMMSPVVTSAQQELKKVLKEGKQKNKERKHRKRRKLFDYIRNLLMKFKKQK